MKFNGINQGFITPWVVKSYVSYMLHIVPAWLLDLPSIKKVFLTVKVLWDGKENVTEITERRTELR